MTTPPLNSAIGWEQSFFAFLREELAPSPARWRATLRLTLLCALGTALVMSLHIPNGEFLIVFFFAVSQPDAWASLRKARLRGIGTLAGGGLAILGILTCGDKPWLFFVAQGLLFAVALFLSRTTTIPYAVILAMFTFVIATPTVATNPGTSLETVLWRILLTLSGAVIGTVAQLVLWPERPEDLLLQKLAVRLRAAGAILDRVASVGGASAPGSRASESTNTGLATAMVKQLDLLASAEAGSRWLRQRHAEQIKLITDVELILLAALRLERLTELPQSRVVLSDATRIRLGKLHRELVRSSRALERGQPPGISEEPEPPVSAPIEIESLAIRSAIDEMERSLRQMPASMAFLAVRATGLADNGQGGDPIREPIAERTIFTSDCTLSNVEVIRFCLKGALAASICYLLYQALNWPGISTCVVTALITAQSSVGAGFNKSLLRLLGAALGGLMAAVVVVGLMPNMQSLASFVVVTAAVFFVASWLTTGSSRISYVGLQTGLVLALVLLNRVGPTIDLTPAGDRFLGVLLGITVMGFIDLTLWPSFAGTALRRKLEKSLRTLAEIPSNTARRDWDRAGEAALAVHRCLASALSLYGEWKFEPSAKSGGAEGRSEHWLNVIGRMEEIQLGLLASIRQRSALNEQSPPAAWTERLRVLDEEVAAEMTTIAALLSGVQTPPLSRSNRRLDEFEQALRSPAGAEGVSPLALAQLQEQAVLVRESFILLDRLREEVTVGLASEPVFRGQTDEIFHQKINCVRG